MKIVTSTVIILFGVLCIADEIRGQNDKRHIALLIAVYALMCAVVLI
jgi:hypothetical protein